MTYLDRHTLANFKGKQPKRPKRKRDGMSEAHLALIRQLPCAAGRAYTGDVEAHHLCLREHRGIGLRAPDRYAIPLSHERHMALHHYGARRHVEILLSWGIDGEALANELWSIFLHGPFLHRLDRMRLAVMEHEVQ